LRQWGRAPAQPYRPLKFMVAAEAGVARPAQIARSFSEHEVRLERLPRQLGAAGARNRGIQLATGDFIAFLDADDEWLTGKTLAQLPILIADPDISFVTCEAAFVDARGASKGVVNPNRMRPHGPDGWKTLLKAACVATPCVMARKSKLLDAGGFNPTLKIAEDQDLWIRLALLGPVHHVDSVLVEVHDR